MKMTQAWGWLTAGVLAAGLNASYHNGGLQWAHQVADRVEYGSAAVMALASGRADQFLTEARLLTVKDQSTQQQATEDQPTQEQTASCRFATTMVRVQSRMERSQGTFNRMEAMSTRQEDRLEASRARMKARIEAQTAHIRIATAEFAPVALRSLAVPVVCPRVRVSVPRLPRIEVPAVPVIHIDIASAGPV